MNQEKIIDQMTYYDIPTSNWWDLRITDLENTVPRVALLSFLDSLNTLYMGGEEFAINHHYHVVIHMENMDAPKALEEFRDSMYDFFKPPRKGNSFYSLTEVRDIQQCFPYTVKDRLGFYSDLCMMDVIYQQSLEISYKKPSGIVKAQKLLMEEFKDNPNQTPQQLWVKLCIMRAEYTDDVDLNKVDRMVRAALIRRDPTSLEFLATQRVFLPEIKILA